MSRKTSLARRSRRPLVLVTGFEPFDRRRHNPSAEVVKVLRRGRIPGIRLHTRILPVAAARVAAALPRLLGRLRPAAVLSLGEMNGAPHVRVERIAVNLLAFPIRDNVGALIRDRPIVRDGPAAYWTTLDCRRLVAAIRRQGLPAALSLSAGSFICNQAMYLALHWAQAHAPRTQAGFIHLPSLPEERAHGRKRAPALPLACQVRGVRAALQGLAEQLMKRSEGPRFELAAPPRLTRRRAV